MTQPIKGDLVVEDRGPVLIVRKWTAGRTACSASRSPNKLEALVDRVDRDPDVHAVVFTGARPGRFVSHADVRWLQAEGAAAPAAEPLAAPRRAAGRPRR